MSLAVYASCSECCSGHAQSGEASCKDSEDGKVLNTESNKTESKICEEKGDGNENGEVKKEEAKDGEVKGEGRDCSR